MQPLPARCVKLFEDETDLLLFAPLRAAWGRRGPALAVPLSGVNARRVLFGTVTITTGHRLFLVRRRQRGEDFRAFGPLIRSPYRGWQVAVLLDEDPSHTAHDSQRLAEQLRIELMWLPQRCPERNGLDHLWGHGQDHRSATKPCGSIDEQASDVVAYLQGLANQDALRQAGIRSENFWLRGVV